MLSFNIDETMLGILLHENLLSGGRIKANHIVIWNNKSSSAAACIKLQHEPCILVGADAGTWGHKTLRTDWAMRTVRIQLTRYRLRTRNAIARGHETGWTMLIARTIGIHLTISTGAISSRYCCQAQYNQKTESHLHSSSWWHIQFLFVYYIHLKEMYNILKIEELF